MHVSCKRAGKALTSLQTLLNIQSSLMLYVPNSLVLAQLCFKPIVSLLLLLFADISTLRREAWITNRPGILPTLTFVMMRYCSHMFPLVTLCHDRLKCNVNIVYMSSLIVVVSVYAFLITMGLLI